MKSINVRSVNGEIINYGELKLYCLDDEVLKFKTYFGMSMTEMRTFFGEYSILKWEDITEYLISKKLDFDEMEDRYSFYKEYKKKLCELSDDAVKLLDMIDYLCSLSKVGCNAQDGEYEYELTKLKIFHFGNVLMGGDINKILLILFELIKIFKSYIGQINTLENYDNSNIMVNKEDYNIRPKRMVKEKIGN